MGRVIWREEVMTIEEMKQKKLQKGYSYAQLSDWSGVPLGTVQKIFRGRRRIRGMPRFMRWSRH